MIRFIALARCMLLFLALGGVAAWMSGRIFNGGRDIGKYGLFNTSWGAAGQQQLLNLLSLLAFVGSRYS